MAPVSRRKMVSSSSFNGRLRECLYEHLFISLPETRKIIEAWRIDSPIAQQTIQRNLAIDASSADVLFMIDDDAYMYPGVRGKKLRQSGQPSGHPLPAATRLCGRRAFLCRAGLQNGGPTPYLSFGIGRISSTIRTLTFQRRPCRSVGHK